MVCRPSRQSGERASESLREALYLDMSARYAIFFCPAINSALDNFGRLALGLSDAETIRQQSAESGSAARDFPDQQRLHRYTTTPAHYGFHATLKAPFELREGVQQQEVLSLAMNLAKNFQPMNLDSLAPRSLANFMALTLEDSNPAVNELAAACVNHFEPVRASLSEADWQKRPSESMSRLQLHYMKRYGYPHVMEEFRFHMTLSGRLSEGEQADYEQADYIEWLMQMYEAIVSEVPRLDRLAVCYQPDRKTGFSRLREFAFAS